MKRWEGSVRLGLNGEERTFQKEETQAPARGVVGSEVFWAGRQSQVTGVYPEHRVRELCSDTTTERCSDDNEGAVGRAWGAAALWLS